MKIFAILMAAMTGVVASSSSFEFRDTSSCPYYLPEGNYEFPHLIVPVNNSDIAIGHSYFVNISPNDCATIFNYDIPASRANQQCSIYFTFPRHDQLSTSNYKYNGNNTSTEGPGTFQLTQYAYNTGATDQTTGNSQPPLGKDGPITLSDVTPGESFKAWTGSCGTGGVMSWKLSSPDSLLVYFQDWNICAIGLWVVYENSPPPAPEPQCGTCPNNKQFASHAAWIEAYTGGSVDGAAL